jgi:hypothetical protein
MAEVGYAAIDTQTRKPPMQQVTQDKIEMAAIQGAALANLLSASTTLAEVETADLQSAFAVLESYFRAILSALDGP